MITFYLSLTISEICRHDTAKIYYLQLEIWYSVMGMWVSFGASIKDVSESFGFRNMLSKAFGNFQSSST